MLIKAAKLGSRLGMGNCPTRAKNSSPLIFNPGLDPSDPHHHLEQDTARDEANQAYQQALDSYWVRQTYLQSSESDGWDQEDYSRWNPDIGDFEPTYEQRHRSKLKIAFKRAVKRICHLLRIRKRWAATGRLLQDSRIQSLVDGLDRVSGVLTRSHPGA